MKLFLGCITNYREFENIKDLVNTTKDVVNGFTITVDSNYPSEDKEKYQEFCNFLEENKKDGKIVYHPYNKAHDWQTNEYLHCGIIKNEDYLWIFDSKELPSDLWVKTIHQSILKCEKENWGAIFFSGRPYLLKFWDHFQCLWSPHWMIHGFIAPVMQGTDQMKKDLIINKRDLIPWLHYSVHNTKYYYEHGRSNQMDLAYGKYGQGVVKFHENERFKFSHYCRKVLNLDFILDSLENYMKGKNLNLILFYNNV